jgi:hypothetical protein
VIQDVFFALAGVRILEQTTAHLVVQLRDGTVERFIAQPALTFDEAELLGLDGIHRGGRFYEYAGPADADPSEEI